MKTDDNRVTVRVHISRLVMKDTVTIELSAEVMPSDVQSTANLLMQQIAQGFTDYNDNVAPTLPETNATTTAEYLVSSCFVDIHDGRRRLRVKCGNWMKYGLVVPDALLARRGYMIAGMLIGETFPNEWYVTVQFGGNSALVIDFRTPSADTTD